MRKITKIRLLSLFLLYMFMFLVVIYTLPEYPGYCTKLWEKRPIKKIIQKTKVHLDQIYFLDDATSNTGYKNTPTQFCIPYKVPNSMKSVDKFPSYNDGYIIINSRNAYSFYKSLITLLHEPYLTKLSELKIKIRQEASLKLNGLNYSVSLYFLMDLPFSPDDWRYNGVYQDFRYSYKSKVPECGDETIPTGKGVFLIRNIESYQIDFLEASDYSLSDDIWMPILSEERKVDTKLEFVVYENAEVYSNSLYQRVFLTPIVVVVDFLVWPFRVIFILLFLVLLV